MILTRPWVGVSISLGQGGGGVLTLPPSLPWFCRKRTSQLESKDGIRSSQCKLTLTGALLCV